MKALKMDCRYLSDAKYQFEDKLVSYDEFNKTIQIIPGAVGQLYAYHVRMIGEFASKEHDTSIIISLKFAPCEVKEDGSGFRLEMAFIHDSEEIKEQCRNSVADYVYMYQLEDNLYTPGEDAPNP